MLLPALLLVFTWLVDPVLYLRCLPCFVFADSRCVPVLRLVCFPYCPRVASSVFPGAPFWFVLMFASRVAPRVAYRIATVLHI